MRLLTRRGVIRAAASTYLVWQFAPAVTGAASRGGAIVIGSSISNGGVANEIGRLGGAESWFTYACAMSNQRIRHLRNSAIGGDTLAKMAARFQADVLDWNPSHVVVEGGMNDAGDTPLSDMKASVRDMANRADDAGIDVSLLTMTAANNRTQQHIDTALAFNDWLRELSDDRKYGLVDAWAATVNPDTMGALDGLLKDDVHPNATGARVIAEAVVASVLDRFPESGLSLTTKSDDAANIVPNGTFSNPEGWKHLANITGGEAVVALEPMDEVAGANWQTVTLSDAVGGGQVYQDILSGWAVGERIGIALRVIQGGCETGGAAFSPGVWFGGNTEPASADLLFLGTADVDGILYAETVIPEGASNLQVALRYQVAPGFELASGRIAMGQATITRL